MTTTYHISTAELNDELLQKLKLPFGKKQLLITVEEDEENTFFLVSKENRDKVKQCLKELRGVIWFLLCLQNYANDVDTCT
jgi:predicted DNA-binding antitoxin AbrB/MazE fold protein